MRTKFWKPVWGALFAALVVAGCAVQSPQSLHGSDMVGTEWSAFAIEGVNEVLGPKPSLRWVSADEVAGTGGCNGFSGRVQGRQETLRFSALAATLRMCADFMPGSQEDKFFKALELTRGARLEKDQLTLVDLRGKVLARFVQIR